MNEIWFRPLVWMDYRLALVFYVFLPFVLLIWTSVKQIQSLQRLLIIYWRVASLLMITLYLMIPGWSISFITSLTARILIPIGLWFWADLNDEIRDLPKTGVKLAVTAWRWATTVYCLLGAIATIPFLSCSFSDDTLATPFCQVWLEVPRLYKNIFHSNSNAGFLGFLGAVGLTVYILYFCYFVFVRLSKQGRSALLE
ncbi:MAG: DUF3177 family protein [Cyanobacteria bacterium J083]|nr:MAG: DUF3177 family protein [Cyanobacteria bacterium J083]